MGLEKEKLEVERILNLIVNFGWAIVKQERIGDDTVLTIKKTIELGDAQLSLPQT